MPGGSDHARTAHFEFGDLAERVTIEHDQLASVRFGSGRCSGHYKLVAWRENAIGHREPVVQIASGRQVRFERTQVPGLERVVVASGRQYVAVVGELHSRNASAGHVTVASLQSGTEESLATVPYLNRAVITTAQDRVAIVTEEGCRRLGFLSLSVSWLDDLLVVLSIGHVPEPDSSIDGTSEKLFRVLWMPTASIEHSNVALKNRRTRKGHVVSRCH